MEQPTLTSEQEAQLRLLELAGTPETDTSRIASELATHPDLWETAELHAEEKLFDEYSEESENADTPGIACYILTTGRDNTTIMQLAIHWGIPDVGWITDELEENKRILRCWWDTPFQDVKLPN